MRDQLIPPLIFAAVGIIAVVAECARILTG